MESLRGIIERITYADEEKGFSVLKINVKNYNELVTIVGNMASVNIGTVVTVEGEWIHNAKYGKQLNVIKWSETIPATVYGIEKYLGSGLIKGIGPQYAKKIVEVFKAETIDIIENHPDRLIEVEKIGKKRVEIIKLAWKEQKEIKNLMIFLQEHNVSTAFGYRIYKVYENNSIEIIRKNPYKLADDIWGIGFKTADTIAEKIGIAKDSYERCRQGIFYALNKFAEEGNCHINFSKLTEKAAEILEVEDTVVVKTACHLISTKELIQESEEKIYLPPFYYAELGTAKRIAKILTTPTESTPIGMKKIIDEIQKKFHMTYNDNQIDAINKAVNSKFLVITGGPGVGKTTITRAIVEVFLRQNKIVHLSAPTGRAAKRMSEACEHEAKTIHRLLDSNPLGGYKINEDNPLEGDVLILDECSMIDILLMYNLLKAIPQNMSVIMIGDADQLPSVGAGNVLRDIIDSCKVLVVRLQSVFRQASDSHIIVNAHAINQGRMIDVKTNRKSDFFFIENERENLAEEIKTLFAKRLPKYYNLKSTNIQVITPMRLGDTGTINLNKILQEAINKNNIMLRRGAIEYRLNDKVMQIKNNYDKDIFNGDIGYIKSVDMTNKELMVDFDGKGIKYDILELDELVLSYAITVHKSQGGEFPIVLMPFTFGHYGMLNRNLLYTAITRAKKALVIVGEKKAIAYAISNNNSYNRATSLDEKLIQLIK